jgi:transposase-like protein
MLRSYDTPTTLADAIRFFSNPDAALSFLAELRWPDGAVCPHCQAPKPMFLTTRRVWKCRACRKQFSIKVGTIFEDSPLGLDKWLPALWMLANSKNGVSSYELARALEVTQKTAWFMLGRIRLAMQATGSDLFEGHVEVDETFLGGKSKNMHPAKRRRMIKGTGGQGKVAVLGILERPKGITGASRVRTTVVKSRKRRKLQAEVHWNIKHGASVYTDAFGSYSGLERDYIHHVIDHAYEYARGAVHTNGLESFWSLLKRTIKGTYVSIDPFHVFRYLDEQVFRFNNRIASDGDRFVSVLDAIIGKRLTYRGLIGADLTPATT